MNAVAKVVNTHHFAGGVDGLPSNTVYVGRPSVYGNNYSSKSGLYSREECVALHRVDIYETLTTDPSYFDQLKRDLDGKDLACWCANDRKVISCHGDNYLHILSPEMRGRTYDKSVVFYLMDDIRTSMNILKKYVRLEVDDNHYTDLYLAVYETALEISYFLTLAKIRKPSVRFVCEVLARIAIELELIVREHDESMMDYRWDHLTWTIERFVREKPDRDLEPIPPSSVIKRKTRGSARDKSQKV